MDMTIIQQGTFVGTGGVINLPIRSDVDWIRVYNYTVAGANQTVPVGVEYYWQRGCLPAAVLFTSNQRQLTLIT